MPLSTFSGNGNYQLDVDAAFVGHSGLSSNVYWRLIVRKGNTYGHAGWGNVGNSGWADGNPGRLWTNNQLDYNFQNGRYGGEFLIAEGTFNVPHRGDGGAEYYFAGGLTLANLGSASGNTGWRSLPHIQTATVPHAPTAIRIYDITMTEMTFQFSGNSDGGSPIREWEVHWGDNPNHGIWSERGGRVNSGHVTVSVPPATRYYFWARGRNDIGWGPWSNRMDARSLAGARVKHEGQWREAVPYVRQNGAWKPAQPYSKINGIWRKSS
jgi:Fibronectin type III domain